MGKNYFGMQKTNHMPIWKKNQTIYGRGQITETPETKANQIFNYEGQNYAVTFRKGSFAEAELSHGINGNLESFLNEAYSTISLRYGMPPKIIMIGVHRRTRRELNEYVFNEPEQKDDRMKLTGLWQLVNNKVCVEIEDADGKPYDPMKDKRLLELGVTIMPIGAQQ